MRIWILVMLALIALALPAAAEPLELHVIAILEYGLTINAAEFGFGNLPLEQCYIEEEWDTDLVIGGVEAGSIAMAFTEPLTGPTVHLGVLRLTCLEPVGDDYEMGIVESESGNLVVVDADTHDEIPADGGCFMFNPSEWWYECTWYCGGYAEASIGLFLTADATWPYCADLLPETTPTESSNWGAIKSLY